MQYRAIPCNTMQYHAIPCNIMQYHARPWMLNNCWRSVPLPCGQYMAIFITDRWSRKRSGLRPTHPPHHPRLFGMGVEMLFKLNKTNYDGFSDVLRYSIDVFDVLSCSQDALYWSEIFFIDSQLCSRCAQMFSDVHRFFQMITDVFKFSLDIL